MVLLRHLRAHERAIKLLIDFVIQYSLFDFFKLIYKIYNSKEREGIIVFDALSTKLI